MNTEADKQIDTYWNESILQIQVLTVPVLKSFSFFPAQYHRMQPSLNTSSIVFRFLKQNLSKSPCLSWEKICLW